MAVDMFLKLDGIKGESRDQKHVDEIDIESYSWGESNFAPAGSPGGGGSGKVSMQDFHFVMRVSRASPLLFLACASGEHIKEGILTVRKAGSKDLLEYLKWTFTDLMISSFQEAGVASSVEGPMDSISLNFAKIEIAYTEQRADGTGGTTFTAGWDLKTNSKV